jgi:O-antigen/teichoic acid export membrane protein
VQAPAASRPTFRGRVFRGLLWKVTAQVFGQGSSAVVAVILARLLHPRDYGLAAMVLVFAALVPIFSDLALGAALVQRRDVTEDDRSTVFWVSAAVGLLFTIAGIGCSWLVADFYGEPAVQPLFAGLSVTFVLSSLGTTQSALFQRRMDFRALELRVMGGQAVGAAVGVVAALRGYGPWAIIGQQIATATVSTLLLWLLCDWKPSFRFSKQSLRDLGGFGGNVLGTRIFFYLNRNGDNLLIGRFLGPASLGAYALAYNVMLSPLSRLAWPIQEVLFPAFARIQEDVDKMRTVWLRVNRVVGALTIPAMAGLAIIASDLVHVVLGQKWHTAVPIIQVLAWVGLLQSLQSLNSSILQARDRTRTLLRYSIIALAASLVGFVAGLHWGVVGVAVGYAIVSTVVEPYYTVLTARSLGAAPSLFFTNLRGVAESTLFMGACVLLVRTGLIAGGVPAAARLAILILLGVVVYSGIAWWRAADLVSDLKDVMRSRGRNAAVVAEEVA